MFIAELEEKILMAILQEGNYSYGGAIRTLLGEVGRPVATGALYVTLDRLEKKGLIEGREEVANAHGGKPRRYFRVSGEGIDALRKSEQVRSRLQPTLSTAGGKF